MLPLPNALSPIPAYYPLGAVPSPTLRSLVLRAAFARATAARLVLWRDADAPESGRSPGEKYPLAKIPLVYGDLIF